MNQTSRRRTVCCIQDGTMDDRERLGDLLDALFRITARGDRLAGFNAAMRMSAAMRAVVWCPVL